MTAKTREEKGWFYVGAKLWEEEKAALEKIRESTGMPISAVIRWAIQNLAEDMENGWTHEQN